MAKGTKDPKADPCVSVPSPETESGFHWLWNNIWTRACALTYMQTRAFCITSSISSFCVCSLGCFYPEYLISTCWKRYVFFFAQHNTICSTEPFHWCSVVVSVFYSTFLDLAWILGTLRWKILEHGIWRWPLFFISSSRAQPKISNAYRLGFWILFQTIYLNT